MQMLTLIKKITPMRMMMFIKYGLKHTKNRNKIERKRGRNFFLLDSPNYGNLGDQAIFLSVSDFLEKNFPDWGIVELSNDEIYSEIDNVKSVFDAEKDVIILTGGGNSGNMYEIYEATRRFVVSEFKDANVIIFPQTVDYSRDVFGAVSSFLGGIIYRRNSRLVYLAREERSYRFFKENYGLSKVFLTPDIVMRLKGYYSENKGKYVGLCLRCDKEAYFTSKDRDLIYREIGANREIKVLSTVTSEKITKENRKEIFEEKLKEFRECELIITDRLHGMIFSYILGIPCIALPNSNGKVESVFSWLKDSERVVYCQEIREINSKWEELKKKIGDEPLIDDSYFDDLIKYIKGL